MERFERVELWPAVSARRSPAFAEDERKSHGEGVCLTECPNHFFPSPNRSYAPPHAREPPPELDGITKCARMRGQTSLLDSTLDLHLSVQALTVLSRRLSSGDVWDMFWKKRGRKLKMSFRTAGLYVRKVLERSEYLQRTKSLETFSYRHILYRQVNRIF